MLLSATACSPSAPAGWSGYAEGDYVDIAAPVAGRLVALPAVRGRGVAAGDELFRLDAEAESAARDEAAARAASARALAADAAKGRRADEVDVLRAQLAQARAGAAAAAAELRRLQALVAQGFIAAARVDDAEAAARKAQAQVAEWQAALRVAALPARADAHAAAEAAAKAAEQSLRGAAWRAAQQLQQAPAAGRIAETYFRIGEWVGAGQPVVSLLPAGSVKARFFVPEAEFATVAVGQPVTLHCDACGAPLRARIDFVATRAEYTPPVIYSNAQRSRLVFLVEARPEGADAARLKPGQPLEVRRAATPAAGPR